MNVTTTPCVNTSTLTSMSLPSTNANFTMNSTTNASTSSNATGFPLWFRIGLVIVGVLTLFGNGVVVYLIASRQRLYTKTNLVVASLAISDICVGLGIIPSFLACMEVKCDDNLSKLFYDAFLFVSVCNLCCITFDRFLAVTRPLRYHARMTRKTVIFLVVVSWIFPTIVSLVPVTWQYTGVSVEARKMKDKIFYTVQVVVFMFCPCLIMLIAYAVILNIAWKHTRNIRHVVDSVRRSSIGPRRNSIPYTTSREAKATIKVFGTVVLMFVVCWSLSAYRTIATFYKLTTVALNVTNASRLLLVANSAINPIIYSLWKKDIKSEIKRLVKSNSRVVRPWSATFKSSSQDLRYESTSFRENAASDARRRSQANCGPQPTIMSQNSSTSPARTTKDTATERTTNGTVKKSVDSETVDGDTNNIPKASETVEIGIDNLVTPVDGLV